MFDLIPRRYTIDNNNSPTTPDIRGNPQLRPELAWGLDAVYDHHLGKDSTLSASVFARRIDDVILPRVGLEAGRWVAVNGNHGRADVYGIALEAQLPLTSALRMRSNFALNRSRTSSVPGPHNRLDSQVPLSANLSFEYRRKALTLGTDLGYQAGGYSSDAANTLGYASHERKLDLRIAWKLSPDSTLRLTLANLLRQDRINSEQYEDANGWRQTRTTARTGTLSRLAFETNF
jgi:outer membrane receptor protein involved in Fe transport